MGIKLNDISRKRNYGYLIHDIIKYHKNKVKKGIEKEFE